MRTFLKLLVVASIALLSWWRIRHHGAEQELVTIVLLGLSGLAAVFVAKGRRNGFRLSILLGLAHLAVIFKHVAPENLHMVLPILGWCILTVGGSALLLASDARRQPRAPQYERHAQF